MKALLIALLASVMMLSVVSAMYDCNSETTIVAGTIYEYDGNPNDNPVSGASVDVTCNNNTLSTTTDAQGHYSVDFAGYQCDYGDLVTVDASKDDMTGSEADYVNDAQYEFGCGCEVNVGIVNVPLIPEFGLLIGSLTIVGALVAFLVIRRH